MRSETGVSYAATVQYLYHCRRQLWLYLRGIRPERLNATVQLGVAVHDVVTYAAVIARAGVLIGPRRGTNTTAPSTGSGRSRLKTTSATRVHSRTGYSALRCSCWSSCASS
ncbi:Dna2/Cas4 domain-containing protein [Streptomyces sp. NPDC050636]|uniref:Dna2/Cas4 domain-containing protein n=1 Tax=Streptomyces sp. NPDC050636 TaxID=3154510 RepID=UPI0034266980